MESFESFEEISGRKFSLGLEAGAGDIGAIVTAGTAWGPAKRDNRIDWGSGAEPGTVSPHLGLVLPASPLGQGAPERTLEGPQNGQSGQQQLEAVSRKELTEGKPAFHTVESTAHICCCRDYQWKRTFFKTAYFFPQRTRKELIIL